MTPYYEQDGISLYVGDNREVLPGVGLVDAVVTDPLSLCLNRRISPAMAREAECHEVGEIVGLPVVGKEPIRADMVYRFSGAAAVLTGATVTGQRVATLRLPVAPTARRWAAEILRVVRTDSVAIPARSGTVLSLATIACRVAGGSFVFLSTSNARQENTLRLSRGIRRVLTRTGTGLPPPIFEPGGPYLKRLSACLAGHINHASIIKQGVGPCQMFA